MSVQTAVGLYGSGASAADQRSALLTGDVPVAVYGLGKMGLPLAAVYASVTTNVIGVDVDAARVAAINRGECPVTREPDLPELVATCVEDGALRATTDGHEAAKTARIHVIIVPTTLRENDAPELTAIRAVVSTVAAELTPGDLVVIESTVPPKTCTDVVKPLLVAESGLDPASFGVAFCPERTASGRALRDIRESYPKVVGGVDAESTRAAALVYGEITANEVVTTDATTAECVKVFEGTYRDVNIALANELARFTDELGIDVREAIDLANMLSLCHIHEPGAGVGGHCIPYYPHFLIAPFETEAPLLELARERNEAMPGFVADRLLEGLEATDTPIEGATVVILGLTYRPGVAETRKSPALPIAERLTAAGATVYGIDPLVTDAAEFELTLVELSALESLAPDAIVLVTGHEEFTTIDWTAFDPLVIVDGRDALDVPGTDHRVYTVGRGWQ